MNHQHCCWIDKSCFFLREALNWTTYHIRPKYFESARGGGRQEEKSQVSHPFVPTRIDIWLFSCSCYLAKLDYWLPKCFKNQAVIEEPWKILRFKYQIHFCNMWIWIDTIKGNKEKMRIETEHHVKEMFDISCVKDMFIGVWVVVCWLSGNMWCLEIKKYFSLIINVLTENLTPFVFSQTTKHPIGSWCCSTSSMTNSGSMKSLTFTI